MALDLNSMPLLAMLKERMGWLSARQNVLSQNVANADTPGYTARDLRPLNFQDILKGATRNSQFAPGLSTTDSHHITLKPTSQSGDYGDVSSPDVEANPTGNTVSLEAR